MRTIYLVRHGQTLFNVHHKIQGTCDSPLTRLGIEQAKAINRYFKKQHIKFDAAFCSTQERACDTLEIITNHQMPYTRMKALKEKNYYDYEGQDEYMLPWRRGYGRMNHAMESDQHVEQRMEQAITKIIDQTKNDATILVVGHGTALRLFTRHVNPDFDSFNNCGIVKMKADDDALQFDKYINPSGDVVAHPLVKSSVLYVR